MPNFLHAVFSLSTFVHILHRSRDQKTKKLARVDIGREASMISKLSLRSGKIKVDLEAAKAA